MLGLAAAIAIGWQKYWNSTPQSASVEVSQHADHIPGEFRLVRVIDGDSIVVDRGQGEVKVRLLGIDCPERNQPFGSQATRTIKDLLGESPLRIKGQKKDRWGRLLAHVYVGSTLVNLELVKHGAAWVYKAEKDVFWADLNEAERSARQSKIGLWDDLHPIYPGDWRKRK